jgi:hypothetical protein
MIIGGVFLYANEASFRFFLLDFHENQFINCEPNEPNQPEMQFFFVCCSNVTPDKSAGIIKQAG